MSTRANIEVFAHWTGLNDAVKLGTLTAAAAQGQEAVSFAYDEDWLKRIDTPVLDPYLQYFKGRFFPRNGAESFSLFLDALPGSWGRRLLERSELLNARKEKRTPHKLTATDLLLGVTDFYRNGALRFRIEGTEEFLTSDEQYILPSLSSLRDLERAALVCSGEHINDKEFVASMELLVPTASALGGKRPKVNVIDDEWQLWLAKLPAANDSVDVGGWEFVAHTLAGLAGIQTAPSMLRKLGGNHHAFVVQRFDRNAKGERIHFASAMTMLGYSSATDFVSGASYLHIVEFLMRHGADVNRDLEELWRRIVFSIAIRNTDDHLRNHGFLLTENGWHLSPVFDLNPDVNGAGLSLNISENDNALDFDLALSAAKYFRVDHARAKSIVQLTKVTVGQWRKVAADAGILKSEIEEMSAAFESA